MVIVPVMPQCDETIVILSSLCLFIRFMFVAAQYVFIYWVAWDLPGYT